MEAKTVEGKAAEDVDNSSQVLTQAPSHLLQSAKELVVDC